MDKDSGATGSWDYLDFELEVREGGPREYPLAVRSPAGEAQAEMHFPFDVWELKDKLQALEIALLRSGGHAVAYLRPKSTPCRTSVVVCSRRS